eukprot:3416989-Rhodomonas_salina.1
MLPGLCEQIAVDPGEQCDRALLSSPARSLARSLARTRVTSASLLTPSTSSHLFTPRHTSSHL